MIELFAQVTKFLPLPRPSDLSEAYLPREADEKYVYFLLDVETSGGSAKEDRVIEIAVVEYERGIAISWYKPCFVLVNPCLKLPPWNTRVHGITNQMLDAKGTTFVNAWDKIREYITGQVGDGQEAVIVAHKASFDSRFIEAELERNNLTLPPWEWSCSSALARTLGFNECKLTTLAKQILNSGRTVLVTT